VRTDNSGDKPDGPPSRDGVPLIPPRKVRVSPRVEPPRAGAILATGSGRTHIAGMVKITISAKAFAALAGTLPLGSVAVEPERAPDGSVGIWLDHATVAKRGPGES
jgi:hypothetical protein